MAMEDYTSGEHRNLERSIKAIEDAILDIEELRKQIITAISVIANKAKEENAINLSVDVFYLKNKLLKLRKRLNNKKIVEDLGILIFELDKSGNELRKKIFDDPHQKIVLFLQYSRSGLEPLLKDMNVKNEELKGMIKMIRNAEL